MWPDRERLAEASAGGTTVFGFPRHEPTAWRNNWLAVVDQVHVTSDTEAKSALLDRFAYGSGTRTLGFVNAHALNSSVRNPVFAADLLTLDHIVRDGVGINALYKLLGLGAGLNLNGTDLMPELIERFAGRRIALLGTKAYRVECVAERLRRELGCEVVTADGFQPDGFYLKLVAKTHPELVVLGMGMPKQERVARLLKHSLHQDVAIVCGGAILDFLSGDVPRAPLLMRHLGLEWAFRLSLEPKRLFGRYVIGNPLFLLRSAVLALLPSPAPRKLVQLPERRASTEAFGIGGPAVVINPPLGADPDRAPADPIATPARAPIPLPVRAVPKSAVSVFSANRPVVERDDLFGRARDLDRLLGWVLDQHGNALIYGPRGYGKTSLVRVFGEIADSRQHVVLYGSGARDSDFSSLFRPYLADLADSGLVAAVAPEAELTVQSVAIQLAGIAKASVVLIIDEFDRIENEETRHDLIELIKDVSDLTAAVRFIVVGVATDATAILGYHPSIHRCITCVPLARLDPAAIAELFTRKAALDGLEIAPGQLATIVALTAGSAYHAQLIGQKLVAQTGRSGSHIVDELALDEAIDGILADAVLMDNGFAGTARRMRDPGDRARLVGVARLALAGADDLVALPDDAAETGLLALCEALVAEGVLSPSTSVRVAAGYRFANAFFPQLVLMVDYRARGQHLAAE
jgi:N-acetylglucosaminyldiphosphoundecaprenol N-acetyl-beta-D-mannosaminyltransferase